MYHDSYPFSNLIVSEKALRCALYTSSTVSYRVDIKRYTIQTLLGVSAVLWIWSSTRRSLAGFY